MNQPRLIGEVTAHILLPNGDSIRRSEIVSVRCGDLIPTDQYRSEAIPPRVIIDFGTKNKLGESRANCTIINCASDEERDELARQIQVLL